MREECKYVCVRMYVCTRIRGCVDVRTCGCMDVCVYVNIGSTNLRDAGVYCTDENRYNITKTEMTCDFAVAGPHCVHCLSFLRGLKQAARIATRGRSGCRSVAGDAAILGGRLLTQHSEVGLGRGPTFGATATTAAFSAPARSGRHSPLELR